MKTSEWDEIDEIWKKLLIFHLKKPNHSFDNFSSDDFNQKFKNYLSNNGILEEPNEDENEKNNEYW